ncbi:MAG: AAA family ATPase [Pseudomonadota bacterium]
MAGRRILITGCSGAGKSTLLAEMAARGWDTIKEPGRRVIRAEERMGGSGLPWADRERFCRLCLKIATADWESVRAGTVLFDRGVVDAALNLKALGQDSPAEGYLRTFPYDPLLILAPPWEALFDADAGRKHTFGDALAEYILISSSLEQLGYRAEVLPQVPVEARADWLEALLQAR